MTTVTAATARLDPQRLTPRREGYFQPQPIAGDNAAPEFRIVDAAQIDALGRPQTGALDQQNSRHLGECFEHQHAGHQRRAGKMALEEIFAEGDVLDCDQAPARLVLDDRVDQMGRIPIAEAIEENGDVVQLRSEN